MQGVQQGGTQGPAMQGVQQGQQNVQVMPGMPEGPAWFGAQWIPQHQEAFVQRQQAACTGSTTGVCLVLPRQVLYLVHVRTRKRLCTCFFWSPCADRPQGPVTCQQVAAKTQTSGAFQQPKLDESNRKTGCVPRVGTTGCVPGVWSSTTDCVPV